MNIRKLFNRLFSWKCIAYLNIGIFAYFVIESFMSGEIKDCIIGLPHLIYALFCFLLELKDKELDKVRAINDIILGWLHESDIIMKQYQELYGNLPEETNKENKE